jgi:hypothetical protein
MNFSQRQTLALAVAVFLAGCFSGRPTPASKFAQSANLGAIVTSAATPGVKISGHSAGMTTHWVAGEGGNKQFRHSVHFQAEPDESVQFATAVVGKLHEAIVASGAEPLAGVPTEHDWSAPVTIAYNAGKVNGLVEVVVVQNDAPSSDHPHRLHVTINETVKD